MGGWSCVCQPYIESATTLSDIHIYMCVDINTDHFTLLVVKYKSQLACLGLKHSAAVPDKAQHFEGYCLMKKEFVEG